MGEVFEDFVCPACGSGPLNVDGYITWDAVEQEWVSLGPADGGEVDYCTKCHTFVHGEFKPITDVKILAQIAIKREEKTDGVS